MKGASSVKDAQAPTRQSETDERRRFDDFIQQRRDGNNASDETVTRQAESRDVALSDKRETQKQPLDPIAEPTADADPNLLELTDIDPGRVSGQLDAADLRDIQPIATVVAEGVEQALSTSDTVSDSEPILLTNDMIIADDATDTVAQSMSDDTSDSVAQTLSDDMASQFVDEADQDLRIPDEPAYDDTLEADLRLTPNSGEPQRVETPAAREAGHSDMAEQTAAQTDPFLAMAPASPTSNGRADTLSGQAAGDATIRTAMSSQQTASPNAPANLGETVTPDSEPQDIEIPKTERFAAPTTAEKAAHAAERSVTINAPLNASDMVRAIEVPTLATAGDNATLPKNTPTLSIATSFTPMTGISERIATTVFQASPQAQQMPVTMDKIPQAVVTVALSSRSATLQIDPPELGRIQLDYQFDNQGRTVITLVPESDAARTALAERMASITAALEQNANGEVDVQLGSSQDFNMDQGQAMSDGSDGHSSGSDSLTHNETDLEQAANLRAIAELERFARSVANGGNDRLHILV